jgi:L-ornithine N5-oxygenase
MAREPGGGRDEAYDVVGVGFGPSNLALAVAVTEHNELGGGEPALTARFVERQPRFGWHRGMLLEDATMQVSFLKDLVTLRNPTSRFSFLCYLHEKERLSDFINAKSFFPLRVEFHDYLEWAAEQVTDLVSWGTEAVQVTPADVAAPDGTPVNAVNVTIRSGADDVSTIRARNLVFALGLEPRLPDGVVPTARVWHNRDLLDRVAGLEAEQPRRFVVVGAGQSAAEVAGFLHRRFPDAEVCAVFSRYGYAPADDSPFANRIFDPCAVDDFYQAPGDVKDRLLGYHASTNYSVVDLELIEELYRRSYAERLTGAERLRLLNTSAVTDVDESPDGLRVAIRSLISSETTVLDADAIVYATGYRPNDPLRLLGPLARHCVTDERGRLIVERDYRVRTTPELRCGIYLQGGTEHTHGLSSSLLSNAAVRAGEIRWAISQRRDALAGATAAAVSPAAVSPAELDLVIP